MRVAFILLIKFQIVYCWFIHSYIYLFIYLFYLVSAQCVFYFIITSHRIEFAENTHMIRIQLDWWYTNNIQIHINLYDVRTQYTRTDTVLLYSYVLYVCRV